MAWPAELAALAAGGMVTAGLLPALRSRPAPRRARPRRGLSARVRELGVRLVGSEAALAAASGWPALTARRLLLLDAGAGLAAATAAWVLTGLPVLSLAGATCALAGVRGALKARAESRRRRRQDEVLEAVRMLRRLLETGGVGVQQGVQALAAGGPAGLREDFREIVAASAAGRQDEAWAAARARLDDPLFDLLCAAIQLQRPGGGRLGPLFREVEDSATAMYEVAREAQALQVQARSAALLVVCLPLVFLVVLSALRSPYLDAYHDPTGEAFLASMLGIIGATYLWIRRWLRLPGEARLGLRDG